MFGPVLGGAVSVLASLTSVEGAVGVAVGEHLSGAVGRRRRCRRKVLAQ